MAECIEGYAWLAARAGRLERAMRLAGAADAIRSVIGTPRPLSSGLLVDDWIADARAGLSDAAAVWEEGRRLSWEEAISLAMDGSDR